MPLTIGELSGGPSINRLVHVDDSPGVEMWRGQSGDEGPHLCSDPLALVPTGSTVLTLPQPFRGFPFLFGLHGALCTASRRGGRAYPVGMHSVEYRVVVRSRVVIENTVIATNRDLIKQTTD